MTSFRDVHRAAMAVIYRTDMEEQPERVSYAGVEFVRCEDLEGKVYYEWSGTVRVPTGLTAADNKGLRHKVYVGGS